GEVPPRRNEGIRDDVAARRRRGEVGVDVCKAAVTERENVEERSDGRYISRGSAGDSRQVGRDEDGLVDIPVAVSGGVDVGVERPGGSAECRVFDGELLVSLE